MVEVCYQPLTAASFLAGPISQRQSLDLIGVNLINFTAYECDFHAVGRLHRIGPNHDGVLITAVKKSAFSRLHLIRPPPPPPPPCLRMSSLLFFS